MPDEMHGLALTCQDLLEQLVIQQELLQIVFQEVANLPDTAQDGRNMALRVELLVAAYLRALEQPTAEMRSHLAEIRAASKLPETERETYDWL